ncbi:MAG: hypothetical protein AMXMBFR64_07100 [Myxococcales bacterium]
MARTPLLTDLSRALRIARFADARHLRTEDAVEAAQTLEHRANMRRRDFLRGVAGAAALSAAWPLEALAAKKQPSAPSIAIIGAGMGGLACADRLRQKGILATIYEAHPSRIGGRISSTDAFPGQVAERGGELIDTGHKTLIGYAKGLGLTLEDVAKAPGDVFYHVGGAKRTEAEVVAEWRELVGRARPDLKKLGKPTFFKHNAQEAALDFTDLATWLDQKAGDLPIIRKVLDVAYTIEYGREIHEQSALNLMCFIHFDRRSKFTPFGVFSDERYHVVEGNDRIPAGLAASMPGQIVMGARLRKLARGSDGKYQLWFGTPDGAPSVLADAVVLTVPFSVLRAPNSNGVVLDPSLGLSADKLRAIKDLPYGTNAKTMIGFDGRPWAEQGCNGSVYTDQPNVQTTWETSWTTAGATAVLTDYSGGNRGAALQTLAPLPGGSSQTLSCGSCHTGSPYAVPTDAPSDPVQAQVGAFLSDLEQVWPGVTSRASTVGGRYVAVRGHWTSQRYSLGSYSCPQPGYFTTIAGLEGQSAGPLKFAGEHTDSFYSWQGYMEGAALSGIAAADELLADIKTGKL